jgi:signal transduction histidine kinase
MLLNLVSNSLKFTDKGKIVIVASEDSKHTGAITLSVSDTGCGIPYDLQPQLFQMFGTFDHNRGQNKHGVGLGLCITQNLAPLIGKITNLYRIFIYELHVYKKKGPQ